MLSYLLRAIQHDILPVSIDRKLVAEEGDSAFFGDLFKSNSELEYSAVLDGIGPEFDLDGCFEDMMSIHSNETKDGDSRKLSNELASTEANENSGVDLEETSFANLGDQGCKNELSKELQFSFSTDSNLEKRPPNKIETSLIKSNYTDQSQVLNEFDQETVMRAKLVSQVVRLIDRLQLSEYQVAVLDQESIQLLSNFSFMIYGKSLAKENLIQDIQLLNNRIIDTKEKKKRNEERIKYVFKRVNKTILSQYMNRHDISVEGEGHAIKQVLQKYFGSVIRLDAEFQNSEQKNSYDRYLTLLFKPSNMYRNDLKDVFSFPSYREDFREILYCDFLIEFKKKRLSKVKSYLKDLKNEIFYTNDKSDPSILLKKVTRLPWSITEVQKGITLFEDFFKAD